MAILSGRRTQAEIDDQVSSYLARIVEANEAINDAYALLEGATAVGDDLRGTLGQRWAFGEGDVSREQDLVEEGQQVLLESQNKVCGLVSLDALSSRIEGGRI